MTLFRALDLTDPTRAFERVRRLESAERAGFTDQEQTAE